MNIQFYNNLINMTGNARRHAESLDSVEEGGQPSLQNALQMAAVSMKFVFFT